MAKYKDQDVVEKLKEVVGPHLLPANTLMRFFRDVAEEGAMGEYEDSYYDSAYAEDGCGNRVEVGGHWIVTNSLLTDRIIEAGGKIVEIAELMIWCNTCSEKYGSHAIMTVGRQLMDGKLRKNFTLIKS